MLTSKSSGLNLLDKYRPATLADIVGQSWVIEQLKAFVDGAEFQPQSAAFVFHGPSGVGKTATAWALAADLGCDMDCPEMGGVIEIPSGQQDGRAVDDLLRSLALRPLLGSGWKVAIINEADFMTAQAAAMWLDGLENLPPRTVVIFTTNDLSRMQARFIGRCEVLQFSGDSDELKAALSDKVKRIWKAETGKALRTLPDGLGLVETADSNLSIRLAIQQLAPYLRTGRPLPRTFNAPIIRVENVGTEAAKKSWETRRRRAGKAVLA
jgi:hypothetical protein